MEKNKAHVFQHKYTGLQMFVYHKRSMYDARCELSSFGLFVDDWVYLGQKTAEDA